MSRIRRRITARRYTRYLAAGPELPMMTVEEYLNSSYPDGDREYLDGAVVERNIGTLPHGLLQAILILHFNRYRKTFGFGVIPECRTRITASRYRVPDVLVVPEPFDRKARFYDGIPLVVVEVLSPDDRLKSTLRRFADYENLGVRFIIQMDPEERVTHVYQSGSLIQKELDALGEGEHAIPFDTQALYAELDS